MDSTPDSKAENEQPKTKKHIGSRLAFAAAFSTVGAKLSLIGTAVDAADLLRDQATFKDKMKTLFSRDIMIKLNERTIDHISDEYKRGGQLFRQPPTGEIIKASMKTMKWTLVTAAVGTVAGAAIGWVRGEKAGSAKNIIKHPIKSAKAVLGFGEPLADDKHGTPVAAPAYGVQAIIDKQSDEKPAPSWQARVTQSNAQQPEASPTR